MKTIYLVKQTTFWKFNGEKSTMVLNAWPSKEAARNFINGMIELNNEWNPEDTEFSYQITSIKLFD